MPMGDCTKVQDDGELWRKYLDGNLSPTVTEPYLRSIHLKWTKVVAETWPRNIRNRHLGAKK